MITSGLVQMAVYIIPVSYCSLLMRADRPRYTRRRLSMAFWETHLLGVYLVTPSNTNIFSAAFPDQCPPENYDLWSGVSNPYYWHGRKDFDRRAQQFQPEIASGAAGPLAADGNQLASVSSSSVGIDQEGIPLASSSNLENLPDNFLIGSLPLNTDNLFTSDETTQPGENLFASTEGEAGKTAPFGLFSVDDSGIFTNDETTTSGGDLLASAEGGVGGTFPESLSSIAKSDVFGGLEDTSLFSKHGRMKARAL